MARLNETDEYKVFSVVEDGIKKTAKTAIKNFSVILSAVTLLALLAVIFADISFSAALTWQFAVNLILILVLFYIMYFSMQANGLSDGRVQDIYINTEQKYGTVREIIRSDHEIENLQEWCDYWIEQELRHVRTVILRSGSIPYDYFAEHFLDLTVPVPRSLPFRKRIRIIRARRMKPVTLTPDMLLNFGSMRVGRSPLGPTPAQKLAIRTGRNVVPMTVLGFFSCSLLVDIILKPGWSTVIFAIIKICFMMFVAYNGYRSGFDNIIVDTVTYVNRQINLICQYMKWSGMDAGEQAAQEPVVNTNATEANSSA